MAECKLVYNNREFETEEQITSFVQQEAPVALQENSPNTLPPVAPRAVVAKVKEFLNRIGVRIQEVREIHDATGKTLDANAQADLLNNIIQIVNGKEDVAITEEAMHFAVEILEQTNPKLLNEMMNKIGAYKIYDNVLQSPTYRAQYTLPDGKINIRAMKKEAIGKVMAETYIRNTEEIIEDASFLAQMKDWMSKVWENFKKLFLKAEFNPFEEAVKELEAINVRPQKTRELAEEIANIESQGIFAEIFRNAVREGEYAGAIDMYAQQLRDPLTYQTAVDNYLGGDNSLGERILELSTPMLQAAGNSTVDAVYNRLVETHKKITLNNSNKETGDSFYEIDGRKIKNRVSDKAKAFYDKAFKGNQLTRTEAQKAIDDYKKDKGTAGHLDMEALFHKYIDDNGYIRAVPLDTPISQLEPNNPAFISKLDVYLKELLETYPEGTRFLSEVRVFNPAQDQAGTMDFVAILPDGKVDIRDWKFMDISDQAGDVPWYKKEAFNIQISEYKNILKKNYGVGSFRQTRAIPIKTKYSWNDWQTKDKLILKGIAIGNIDVSKITDLTLLPVATKDESTGNISIDALIKKMNALYEKLSKEKVEEGRRDIKKDKLKGLERAIRTLQLQQSSKEIRQSATSIIAAVERDLEKYTTQLADTTSLSREQMRNIATRIIDDYDIVETFTDLDGVFKKVDLDEGEYDKIKEVADKARNLIREVAQEGGVRQIAGDIIAKGYGISDLLDPEAVLSMMQRNYRSLSQAGTAATRVLWKMQEKIKAALRAEFNDEVDVIQKHKEAIEKAAAAKGLKVEDLLKKMLHYKDKRWTGKIIGKIDPEFYIQLQKALKDGNKQWVKDNVDMAAYTEWYTKRIAEQTVFEASQTYDFQDEEANKAERERRIKQYKDKYSPVQDSGFTSANDKLLSFPLQDKWKSKEYMELEKTPELLAFYNYWQDKMKESYKSGMIQGHGYYRFVPNVKKSFLEKQFEGISKGKKTHKDYFRGLQADEQEQVIDPLTGKPVDHIAPLYLYDLGQRATDDKGTEFIDYSQKSDDLFKIMALWSEEMVKFKLRTEVEAEAKLIQAIEKGKGHLVIDRKNNIANVVEGNEDNAKYFDNFMNNLLYGRRYTEKGDLTTTMNVGKYVTNVNNFFRKTIGMEPLPQPIDENISISGTRFVESLNRWFQMKTLGWNIPSALTNYIGGTANAYINAGKHITKADIWKGQTRLASGKFQDKEGQIAAGLVEYFVPLTDDEKREKAASLSVKGAVANMSSDWLFYLQRKSERFVQLPIFFAFAENTMVEDGKLVNIREFVRNKNNYDSIYSLPREQRQETLDKIEKEINELKSTRNLYKIATIENDKLVIPGIQKNSDTAYAFTNRVQQFSKDALGNMDQSDIYQYRMNILTKSMMMFKNWIPRLFDVRFGGLRYTVGKDEWEWGRVNMLWNGIFSNLANATGSLIGIATGQENLIDKAKKLYILKRSQLGEREFMTEAEFVDMYVKGAEQLVKEILTFASMAGLLLAVGAAAPDDDDEITKGGHKWALRLLDKGVDELSFFYNPIAMTSIANGSIFPAMGTIVDLERFAQKALTDGFYTITGDEEGQDKTKTLKHLFKAIPITKEFTTYMGIFSHELANEFGIHVSTEARPR